MNDKTLRSVLARSLNWKDLDLVDEFLKHHGCENLHRHKLPYCSDKASRRVLRGVKAFNLVPKIEHLLLEFFLLDLVFVRQSHKPIVCHLAVYVVLVHTLVESKKLLASCRSRRQGTLCRFSFNH